MAAQQIETNTETLVGLYTMYYRHPTTGNALLTKNFRLNGNLKDARARAEVHCGIMGGKLNFVQPMITDLKREEEYTLGNFIKQSDGSTVSVGEKK